MLIAFEDGEGEDQVRVSGGGEVGGEVGEKLGGEIRSLQLVLPILVRRRG